jgi:hypothetical protein
VVLVNIQLYSLEPESLIEKVVSDLGKKSNAILVENKGSMQEKSDSDGEFWVRSSEYNLNRNGFSWFFIQDTCREITYRDLYDGEIWGKMISAFSKVLGESDKRDGDSLYFGKDTIALILNKNNGYYITIDVLRVLRAR